jgi:hypothetical protein
VKRRVATKEQLAIVITILAILKWGFAVLSAIAAVKVWLDPSPIQTIRMNGVDTLASKAEVYFFIALVGMSGSGLALVLGRRARDLIDNHPDDHE